MQTQAYEGYFDGGQFYVNGKAIRIPERRRIVLAIMDGVQNFSYKQSAWNDFKRMVKETGHENVLLDDDAFSRTDSGRDFIDFTNGE